MRRRKIVVGNNIKKIVGYRFEPDVYNPNSAVILSHGFMSNQLTTRLYAEVLAELGFAAFTYDFCGGGVGSKSTGSFSEMTISSEVNDLLTMIDYVQSQGFKKISLAGFSQGGFVSSIVAAEIPEIISSLVLFYPAYCIPDDARRGNMLLFKFDPDNIPDYIEGGLLTLNGNYAREMIDKDAFEMIKGYNGPTLILHGDEDKIVDVSYSQKAISLYPKGYLHVISGGTHGFKGDKQKEAISYMKDFMKTKIII